MATGDPPHEVAVFEQLLRSEERAGSGEARPFFAPLVSWLVTTLQPALTVELAPGGAASLPWAVEAACEAVTDARGIAVRLRRPDAGEDAFRAWADRRTERFGRRLESHDDQSAALAALAGGPGVDLLHLSLFDLADGEPPDVEAWAGLATPGTAIVVTSAAADSSSVFARTAQLLADRYPAVRIPLGFKGGALVAQAPVEGAVPAIDALRNAPAAMAGLLALERVEPVELVGEEPLAPADTRVLVGRLLEHQHVEREAFLSAMRAYRELASHLSLELAGARQELESARLEREQLLHDFLDRLDVLSAKISTSATKYTKEIEEKDRLLEEHHQQVLAYAGRAADARSVIDDMRVSSSWRLTAPLRLLSRLLARRHQPDSAL